MSDQDSVKAANEEYYQAYNARDIEAMDRIWAKNVAVACIHSSYPKLSSREDVLKSYRVIFDVPNLPQLIHQQDTITVTGDTALVTAYETWAGGKNTYAATKVFVREDGEWRLVLHHSSPVTQRVMRSGRRRGKPAGNGNQ